MFVNISTAIISFFITLSEIAGKLIGWVLPMVIAGLTIQLMWHGFNILRGSSGSHAIFDVFAKLIRSFMIISLCLLANGYTDNVTGMQKDIEESLITAAGGTGDKYAGLDITADKALTATNEIIKDVWGDISIWHLADTLGTAIRFTIVSGIMYLCILIFCVISAIDFIVIDISIKIIMALGPIFVACWAFEATSRFFDSWLSAVIKYTVTIAIINILVITSVKILESLTAAVNAGTRDMNILVTAIAAACVLSILVSKASSLAGDIVGGNGINLSGGNVASKAASLASGGAGRVMNMAKTARSAAGSAGKAGAAGRAGGAAGGGGSGGLAGKAANVVAGAAKGAATGGKAGAIKGAAQGAMK